ncbi:hypothetical protein EDE11_105104 [Methylomonas methanica]|uniref:Uncharacterized protein n=2 Tax=Methylomonas TaxID=416 RepID=A0A126T7F6_9GAMM|nr:hypothetical protein JT25_016230 [Methylomonas denitrificans]OAI07693.1 hypothetical protein A1342_10410 [Methylomonas methanica]TCV85542.1 hypothetical protein EDE11_105104 [Methylomonas methanica]
MAQQENNIDCFRSEKPTYSGISGYVNKRWSKSQCGLNAVSFWRTRQREYRSVSMHRPRVANEISCDNGLKHVDSVTGKTVYAGNKKGSFKLPFCRSA